MSRQRWKYRLFLVNNAPRCPPHPSAVQFRAFQGQPPVPGRGAAADLKRASGPGVEIGSAVTGRKEGSRWPAVRPVRPRRPSLPHAQSPGLPKRARALSLPHGSSETTRAPRGAQCARPNRKSEAPASPQTRDLAQGSPAQPAEQKLSSPSGEVGGGLPPAPRVLPLRPLADWKRPATGRAGGEDG